MAKAFQDMKIEIELEPDTRELLEAFRRKLEELQDRAEQSERFRSDHLFRVNLKLKDSLGEATRKCERTEEYRKAAHNDFLEAIRELEQARGERDTALRWLTEAAEAHEQASTELEQAREGHSALEAELEQERREGDWFRRRLGMAPKVRQTSEQASPKISEAAQVTGFEE